MGRERRSMAMTEENKKFTAWHEAGHALVNVLLEHTHPLHKVTIIPRGQTLGSTMSLPKEDVLNHRRKEMLDIIAVTMAGRIAEEIVSGDISSGATGDIQQATSMARAMVCAVGHERQAGHGPIRRTTMTTSSWAAKWCSARITANIPRRKSTRKSNASSTRPTRLRRDLIDWQSRQAGIIANALLEYETLDGSQVEEIVRTGKFTPPPPAPKVDPP